ncbi:MAG: MBL fold metallo-hydrolase [Planctomycetota bacterium]|nr:MAG: MBL fold metallo-hydrolase [Planctomycetota bacterium]
MTRTARLGPVSSPPELQIGDLPVRILDGGSLWLDGGAMFGIIPKPVWSRTVEVDESNRIPLATTCFLVETGGRRVLIESGCGHLSKYSEKEQGFFSFGGHWLLASLQAIGLDRGDIDIVILTHLHFDHAGGGTMPDGGGGWEPTFPRARYVVQRGEWEDAVSGHAVMTGTYRRENLEPLDRAGVLALADGPAEIAPGVSVRVLPGHTRHQQGVWLESGGRRAALPADLMPTSAHVGFRYNMAYDLLPFENMVNKESLLRRAVEEDLTLLLGQDPTGAVWRVEKHAVRGYVLGPA